MTSCEKVPGNKALHNLEGNLFIPKSTENWTRSSSTWRKSKMAYQFPVSIIPEFESKSICNFSQIINTEYYCSPSKTNKQKHHAFTIKTVEINYWQLKTEVIITKSSVKFYTFTNQFQPMFMCQADVLYGVCFPTDFWQSA